MKLKKEESTYTSLKKGFQCFILDIMLFDIWLQWKICQAINYFGKLFIPTLKVLFYTSIGFGFVAVCTMICLNIQHANNKSRSLISDLTISGDTRSNERSLVEKKFQSMREEIKFLEYMLQQVNTQVKKTTSPDKNEANLPDFASLAGGGSIISTPETVPYISNTHLYIFGIALWKTYNYSPKKVLQPWTQAGECWAFKGQNGKIEIQLAHTIFIESVTLEHIPLSYSLTGSINSAPKDFQVYGYFKEKYNLLDSFTYQIDRNPTQTFKIKNDEVKRVPIQKVLLEILSNWGNTEYTCIYRFKVHGKIYDENESKMHSF